MPPYRNPLEQRSAKYAARQYVSETHDHKPDAPMRIMKAAAGGKSTDLPLIVAPDQEQP